MYVYILFFLSPEILNLLNTQTIMCCDVLLVLTVCLLRRLPRQVLLLVSLPAVMTVYSDILPVPQLCAIFTGIIEGIPSDMPDKVQHRKLKCLRDVISSPLFEPKGLCLLVNLDVVVSSVKYFAHVQLHVRHGVSATYR